MDGARIVNGGQGGSTVLSAGQNLSLGEVKGSGATVQTSVQGQGDTVLSAGQDLSTRNAQLNTTQGTLALTAGQDLALKGGQVASGDVLAVVAGRDVNLDASAPALRAQGNLQIQAGQDVNAQVLQASSQSGTLAVVAGRDVNLLAKTTTVGGGDNSRTTVQGSSLSGANVVVTAGQNTTLQAAQVVGTVGSVTVSAGNDINLTTATEIERSKTQRDANNWKREATSTEIGTQIVAQGDIVLNAGQDLTARAAQVNSATGAVVGVAGRDINIQAGESVYEMEQATQSTSKKLFSKKTTTTYDAATQVSAVGSTFSGDTTVLQAGRDLAVTGSTVVATNATVLTAGGNVTIEAAKESLDETHRSQTKKSGLMSSGGIGITLGSKRTSTDAKNDGTLAAASMVGSTEGSVVIEAAKDYTQTGSQIITPVGDVDIRAQRVVIDEAEQTTTSRITTKVQQSGVTLALSGGVIDAIQGVQHSAQAMGDTKDGRAKALAVANMGMQGMGGLGGKGGQSGQSGQDDQGSVRLSLSLGSSQSTSQTDSSSRMAVGSTVAAGGNLSITAAGAGADSDLTVQGSRVQAGGDATLKAEGDILLQAAKNLAEQHSTNKSSSASIGIGISLGQKTNWGVTVSASAARGNADGQDTTWTNTQVQAGGAVKLESGGDTALKGAVVAGNQVTAKVGGDLLVQSLQDTSTFGSKQQSIAGSVTIGPGGGGNVSASQTKVNGDYASVTEQSGIKAGDGGFQIDVKGGTDLKGGVISSSQAAIDAGKNSLSTATLVTSDIANHDNYKATSITVSGGSGGGSAGIGQEKGSQSSVTKAGISGADITITDEAGQRALTGKDGSATVAAVNREVVTGTDTSGALKKAWDGQQLQEDVQAQASITAEFGKNAANKIGTEFGAKRDELKAEAKKAQDAGDTARAAELNAEAAKWDEGGAYRVAAHALVGGLTGGASGAVGAAAGTAAAPVIAEQVEKMGLSDPLRKAVIAVADTAVGAAAGALAGGGTAGAVTAGNQVVNNYLKHEELQAKRKELAECKTDACRQDVEKKWGEVSQKRDQAMETLCRLGSSEQCRGVIAEAQADIAALKANGTPGGVLGLVPEERNNIKQAAELVKGGLQVLQQTANLALDSTYAGSDEIAKAGLMTEKEIQALKQKNSDQAIEIAMAVLSSGGSKGTGSKSTAGASNEAPASAGQARSGSAQATGSRSSTPMLKQDPVTGLYEPAVGTSVAVSTEVPLLTALVKAEGAVPLGGTRAGSVGPLPVGAVELASPQSPAVDSSAGGTRSGAVSNTGAAHDGDGQASSILPGRQAIQVDGLPAGSPGVVDLSTGEAANSGGSRIAVGASGGVNLFRVEVDVANVTRGTPEYNILNAPPPNAQVKLSNGTEFKTNPSGYVDEVTYGPSLTQGVRDARQTAAGKEGLPTDVGGHIQACSLGGTCDRFNLFPQDGNFNNSGYKRWENEIKGALNNGDQVGPVTIRFNRTDPASARPDSLTIDYSVNGVPKQRFFENKAGK